MRINKVITKRAVRCSKEGGTGQVTYIRESVNAALQHHDGLPKVGGGEEDQKLLGEGQLRKSETKWGGRAEKQPKRFHKTQSVGQTAWRPYAPIGVIRHDDDEKGKCFH